MHLCGPACEFLARSDADVMPLAEGAGDADDLGDEESSTADAGDILS